MAFVVPARFASCVTQVRGERMQESKNTTIDSRLRGNDSEMVKQ